MNIWIVLLVVLLVLAFAGAPNVGVWQHNYGWYPSGGIGLIVLILIVLLLAGKL